MRTYGINHLLKDGFTEKMAMYYQKMIDDEKSMSCFDQDYREWAHNNGFLAESALTYNLTDSNLNDYLSDYDFWKLWPLNSWTRIWINDKLTLKYLLAGTEFSDLMPKYYYYMSDTGLRTLIDHDNNHCSVWGGGRGEDFLNTLRGKGVFACKPCNGSTAIGFFKMSYEDGFFYAAGEALNESTIDQFLKEHSNYVFTEYLRPSNQFAQISPQIHTLRLVTLNIHGDDPVIIGGYLRFPTRNNGDSNYCVLDDVSIDKFNYFCEINPENGYYFNPQKTYINRVEKSPIHPDSGIQVKGMIENYDELKNKTLCIAKMFNTLEFLGFDIGVTDKGFKIMEINSHPGVKYMQLFTPLMKNGIVRDYFSFKLQQISQLSDTELEKRIHIQR